MHRRSPISCWMDGGGNPLIRTDRSVVAWDLPGSRASATHSRLRSKRRDEELLRAMTSSGGKVGNYGHLLYEHAVQSAKKKERIREEKR